MTWHSREMALWEMFAVEAVSPGSCGCLTLLYSLPSALSQKNLMKMLEDRTGGVLPCDGERQRRLQINLPD